jgi:hypothetical protein
MAIESRLIPIDVLSALYSTLQPDKESFQIDKHIVVTGRSKGEAHDFMLATWMLILALKKRRAAR